MKTNLQKIAAVLAFIIGAMAIFAGAQTLLGKDPGYYVINWLLLYNYTAGILTVFRCAAASPGKHGRRRPARRHLVRQGLDVTPTHPLGGIHEAFRRRSD